MKALGCLMILGLAAGGPVAGACAESEDEHIPPQAATLDSDVVEVPMDLATGRPLVKVAINGRGPYDFILDTGAACTVVDAGLAQELELPVVGETTLGDPTHPEAIPAQRVRAESVRMGGLQLSGVTMVAFGIRKMMGNEYGGVLGLPDLEGMLVSFDYPRGLVTLRRGELLAGDPRVVAYEPSGRIISLPMKVTGKPVTAHLDSGNPGSFTLPRALAGEFKFKSEPVQIGMAGTVNQVSTIWGAQIDGEIEVAGITFRDPEVNLTDMLGEWANIGGEAMRDLTVTIDQANRRLRMERTATAPRERPARRRVGLMFAGMRTGAEGLPIVEGGLKLDMVAPGSLAEKAGLKAGDIVLSVNQRSVKDLTFGEISQIFASQVPLHMEVGREGKVIAVHIE